MARPGKKKAKPNPPPKNSMLDLLKDIRAASNTYHEKLPRLAFDMSEIQKKMDSLTRYANQMQDYENAFKPTDGTVRGDTIFRFGRFIKFSDLPAVERQEKWKSYSTEELDDMIDSLLDEVEARRQKKHDSPNR